MNANDAKATVITSLIVFAGWGYWATLDLIYAIFGMQGFYTLSLIICVITLWFYIRSKLK